MFVYSESYLLCANACLDLKIVRQNVLKLGIIIVFWQNSKSQHWKVFGEFRIMIVIFT